MSKNYVDYMVEETKNILAIDSPSGYTNEVADYVMGEYKKLGYEPKLTVKGGVLVPIGGRDKGNAVLLEAHIDTLGAMVAEIKANGMQTMQREKTVKSSPDLTENMTEHYS